MVGQTLGTCRIVEKIGRGGMGGGIGVVYRGVDETLDRQVAIKAIFRIPAFSPGSCGCPGRARV